MRLPGRKNTAPEGMVPASKLGKAPEEAPAPEPQGRAELHAKRERLVERYAATQLELGGLFYEMAIREHVRMDVLTDKAADLQAIDAELGQVERLIKLDVGGATGTCPSCGALYARGAAFCSQCGHALVTAPTNPDVVRGDPLGAPPPEAPAEPPRADDPPTLAREDLPGG